MYDVLDVARYIINYSVKNNQKMNNSKLQKVLYFIQAAFLTEINNPCFNENLLACDNGVIILDVYNEYKWYSNSNLPYINEYFNFKGDIWNWSKAIYNPDKINLEHKEIINKILDACSDYSDEELSEIIMNQDPWLNSYLSGWNNIIDNRKIKYYFQTNEKKED